jgi:hypothetical protein
MGDYGTDFNVFLIQHACAIELAQLTRKVMNTQYDKVDVDDKITYINLKLYISLEQIFLPTHTNRRTKQLPCCR